MIRPDASMRGEENISTPAEAASLMTRIARCELPITKANCDRLRATLEMPKDHAVRDPLPANLSVALKPGNIEGVQGVWTIVALPDRPYVITVMSNYGGSDEDGLAVIRKASAAAYDYFSRLARSTPYGARVPLNVAR